MFARDLSPPSSAFFLFGPRGTGKSTWIRTHFAGAHVINLLAAELMVRFEREPALLRAEVLALPKSRWIVLDEVQRAPRLLDEVHHLMEEHGHKRFALTGSSARKLKRGAANLLAGRAITRHLYPLTAHELASRGSSGSRRSRPGSGPTSRDSPVTPGCRARPRAATSRCSSTR